MTMKSVKAGDKVRVEGYGSNGLLYRNDLAEVAGAVGGSIVTIRQNTSQQVDNIHLRDITEIVECGPGHHEWKPSCVAKEPHTQCMTAMVCTRCGKREEPKPEPEPVCWKCGCRKDVHWYKGSHAGCSAYAHDRRKPGNDRRKSNTSMYSRRVGTLEVGASYRYTGSGWDQRGTMKDRRRG